MGPSETMQNVLKLWKKMVKLLEKDTDGLGSLMTDILAVSKEEK
jgi:hypothetical protein